MQSSRSQLWDHEKVFKIGAIGQVGGGVVVVKKDRKRAVRWVMPLAGV